MVSANRNGMVRTRPWTPSTDPAVTPLHVPTPGKFRTYFIPDDLQVKGLDRKMISNLSPATRKSVINDQIKAIRKAVSSLSLNSTKQDVERARATTGELLLQMLDVLDTPS